MSIFLIALVLPFLIQAGMTFFDEFYYHHKRGLPNWEILGHPLDTLTVLTCYSYIIFASPSPQNLAIYIGLAFFSCLFVTKDEFIHSERCPPAEQWLHSMLFIFHPIVLGVLPLYWYGGNFSDFLRPQDFQIFRTFIQGQIVMVTLFLAYQVSFWSRKWNKHSQIKLTTNTTTPSVRTGIPPKMTP